MTRSTKLLSVLAAVAASACVSSPVARRPTVVAVELRGAGPTEPAPAVVAVDVVEQAAALPSEAAPPVVAMVEEAAALAATPLLAPSGRPACGNVIGKGGRSSAVYTRDALQARLRQLGAASLPEDTRLLARLDACIAEE